MNSIQRKLAVAVVTATLLPGGAGAEPSLLWTAMPVDPTAAQCMAAIEEGTPFGVTDDGQQIFWSSGTAYFVKVSQTDFQCSAVRYIAPSN